MYFKEESVEKFLKMVELPYEPEMLLTKSPGTKAQMMPYFNSKFIQLQPPLAYTDNQ